MGGITLRDGTLVVERDPNRLDEIAVAFSAILDELDIAHVYVSGYVTILAGRARATEDIDVIIEAIDEDTADRLATILRDEGYWGPAMPLTSLTEVLDDGGNVWVAPRDQLTPHLEVKTARDEFDRASLENALTARIAGETIPIGPFELQIADTLSLGTRTDIEDAVHLYTLFAESLSDARLEGWVTRLGVEEEYDELKRA